MKTKEMDTIVVIKIVIKELEKLKELSFDYEEPIDSWGSDDIFIPNIIQTHTIDKRIEEETRQRQAAGEDLKKDIEELK